MTASPCDHGQLPAILVLVCLSVSSIWLVKNQKFTWSSTFLWTIFQHGLTFFWWSSWLWACLKAESYTEVVGKWPLGIILGNFQQNKITKFYENSKKLHFGPFLLTLRQTKTNTQIPRKVGYRRGYRKMHRQAWI